MNLRAYFSIPGNSQSELGAKLTPPVTQGAISQWLAAGIPLGRCVQIEKATGGQVTRKDLRPDDWHLIWPELSENA